MAKLTKYKLTKSERIGKLSRAIWEYRGRYNVPTQKWTQPPKPSAASRIRKWLESLGVVDVEVALKRIDGFESQAQFHAFLKEVEEAKRGNG